MKGGNEGNMSDRLYFKGALVRDDNEFLCLTDMWRAAEGGENKRPVIWLRHEATEQFAEYLRTSEKVTQDHLFRSEAGRNGSTWAHWQLAMAYAKYLSPEFHAWCNEVVRAVMEGRQPPGRAEAEQSALMTALAAIANGMRDLATVVTTRLDAMQEQINQLKNGGLGAIITKAQSDFLLSECRSIAATFYAGKQAKSVKAALCSVHNRLRKELEWFGTGRTFRRLPAMRYADALAELTALRREANAAAGAMANAKQITLEDVIAHRMAEEEAKKRGEGSGEKH